MVAAVVEPLPEPFLVLVPDAGWVASSVPIDKGPALMLLDAGAGDASCGLPTRWLTMSTPLASTELPLALLPKTTSRVPLEIEMAAFSSNQPTPPYDPCVPP